MENGRVWVGPLLPCRQVLSLLSLIVFCYEGQRRVTKREAQVGPYAVLSTGERPRGAALVLNRAD
jgi:hypothetical protein